MTKAIKIYKNGGPEVLKWETHDPGAPAKGEVLVRHEAVGLNFIDVYHRTGLYPLPELPAIPGLEGAGVVEAVGDDVSEFKAGDRVAYAGVPPGAYAQSRCIPAHRLVGVPDNISFDTAAAMMLKGMTARYLIRGCYPVKSGDTILIHAAAGVDVVYDSVGQATFMKSLDCLKPFGMMVSFGQSSGSIPPFETGILAAKGSLFLTRPSLMTYTAKREDLLAHAEDLFDAVGRGAVEIEIKQHYALSDAALAHADLEGRKTTGSTILVP